MSTSLQCAIINIFKLLPAALMGKQMLPNDKCNDPIRIHSITLLDTHTAELSHC